MQMGYNLNLEQTQKLLMTPKLCQAITVLQLSSLELSAYIEQQLEENPLLELREDGEDGVSDDVEKHNEPETEKQDYGFNWEDYFVDQYYDGRDGGNIQKERQRKQMGYSYEKFLSQTPTLSEHLLSQLNLTSCYGMDKLIGEYLIGNIDDNGYLRVSLAEVKERLNVAPNRIAKMLNLIQSFEPVGVGARNLQECLLIQIERLGIKDEVTNELINHHLTDLAKGRLAKIAHDLGVSILEVQESSDLIKTLDPKPGRNFTSMNDACYIIPDVVLEKVGGEYIILVNDVTVPRVTVNSAYRSVLSKEKNFDSDTRRFVENKLNAAVWLIRSIEQRRLTLYKVASCLVELQRDFLESGIKYLKPLNLKKVAEMVGLHESTVSRATSNKYIQTPRGVFEMKCFFSTGLNNDAGTKISAGSIKKLLQEIIAGEDNRYPLNDQKIAEIFSRRGIQISRRTVAKYRDELSIPAVQKRKRY
ncbi:MAG: RNA polymerase sigma-54 factor [Pelotomaculum sp. PtaB.Bin013]|nr:MAG: RNA polymerase sigma-54 factor [Pelotomaculum sp. PtaB.Bin013]